MPKDWDPSANEPSASLQRLIEGNTRFRDGTSTVEPRWTIDHANDPQRPFAIILACSDSRTPVEILFDQGFGDLFVVRVAGNIVAPSLVGSIEFAASEFGSRLVVVMGHTQCGAISATVRAVETGLGPTSANIRSITDRIAPHIEGLVVPGVAEDTLVREAMRANVRASADHLRHGSRVLENLVLDGSLVVVGAEYELETGEVHFIDGVANHPSAPPSPRARAALLPD